MASKFRSLYDLDVQAELSNLPVASPAPSQPPVDLARAQTLARSTNNPQAQREGARMIDADERQQRAEAYRSGVLAKREQKEAAKQQESAAKEQAKAMEQQRMAGIREAKAAGVKTIDDIETGKTVIATHPDGAPKFDAGPIKDAPLVPTTRIAVPKDPATGQVVEAPGSNPMVPGDGALGATGGQTRTSLLQPIRDDRGNESLVKPVTTTDKRGVETVTKTDPVTGQPGKHAVGVDPEAYEKARKAADIEQRGQAIALRQNNVAQARVQFQPRWEPVKKEFDTAGRELNSFPQTFRRNTATGKMEKIDPKTDSSIPYDPRELVVWQKDREDAEARLTRAKQAHDKLSPMAENLNRVETETKIEHLKLRADQIANELPVASPETAQWLAKSEVETPDPDQEAIASVLPDIPQDTNPAGQPASLATATNTADTGTDTNTPPLDSEKSKTTPQPLIPPDTKDPAAVLSAFAGLQGVEGMTLEARPGSTFTPIQKAGRWIGSVQDGGNGQKVITLTDAAHEDADINKTIALGVTSGAPVYLRDNGQRKDVAKEAQFVAGVFQAASDPANTTKAAADARIRAMGAGKPEILARVNSGELSMQAGETLMRDLYGDTLKSTPLDTPEDFGKWLGRTAKAQNDAHVATYGTPATETVWNRWANKTNLKDRQEVKREYLRDWYQTNRGKPGVTRERMRQLYGKDVADSATAGERVVSAIKTGGRMIRDDVGGSMLGLISKPIVGLGAAEAALFGSKDGKDTFNELATLTNRDTANFAEAAKRNFKIWTTDEGQQVATQLDAAMGNFQRTIDEQHETGAPDKAKIAAAGQAVTQAALALHGLSPDPSWPVTADSLDFNKDPAMGAALARYVQTADPREMALFKERLLMSNGRRQFSAEMEKKTAGMGSFGAAVIGGMHAGWQEVATEALADVGIVVTAGGSKAIQAGLKGAGLASKANRVARLGERIGQALEGFEKLGTKADSLVNPLTRGQKLQNTAVGIAKTGVQASVGEGLEEVIAETGADAPDFLSAFASGALGGVALVPVFHLAGKAVAGIPERAAAAQRDAANAKWTQRYNASMADQPGFKAITPDQAMIARTFVDPQQFEQSVAALAQAKQALDSVQGDEGAKGQLRAAIDAGITGLASQTQDAIAAVNEISDLPDEAQRTYYSGIAKVATGNEAALTQAERSAIQGGATPTGAPLFAEVPSPEGLRTVLTDEARAHLRLEMPAVGSLVRTAESDAIYDSIGAGGSVASGNGTEPILRTFPESSGNAGLAGNPDLSRASEPNQEGVSGVPTIGDNGGSGSVAPGVSDRNTAQLEAAEYATLRQADPSLPEFPEAVKVAIDRNQPVSVSMAKAARLRAIPPGYTRQGTVLVPQAQASAENGTAGNPEPTGGIKDDVPAKDKPDPVKDNPAKSQVAPVKSQGSTRLKAESATERAGQRFPSLQGRFAIDDSPATGQSAGAFANTDGKITIQLADLEKELAGFSPEKQDARLDAILDEEIIHLAQFEAVRRSGQDVTEFYAALWDEFTPEQQAAAANTYQAAFATQAPWQRAAETVRILIQEKADGRVTELTKAFSKNVPERLIQLLKDAVAFLRGVVENGQLSQRVQDAISGIESILAEFQQPESNGKVTVRNATVTQTRDIAEAEAEAEAERESEDSLTPEQESSPMRVTGLAIADAAKNDERLTPERKRELDFALEEFWDLLETLQPSERRAFTDQQIAAWLDSLPAESQAKDKPAKSRRIDNPARARAFQLLNSGNYDALSKLFQSGTKLAPRPNAISLILARRKSGAKLTNKEISMLGNDPEYDGAIFQNQFANSGDGKVAREILSILTARQGEGTRPDVMASDYLGKGLNASDLWEAVWKELNSIASNTPLPTQDPLRERSEAEIAAELAKGPDPETATEQRQDAAFTAANTPENGEAFNVADFTPDSVGATVTVDGEEMRITAVEMDSLGLEVESVILDDHTRFGRQVLDSGETIYLEAGEVEEGALFASPSPRQPAFDFGTSGGFNTRNQPGFDFEPASNNRDTLAGKKVDAEWNAFAPRSGTLGIPRAEMPQVKADDRSALVQYLRARGVAYEAQEVLPGTLKPTQAEYSPAKVRKAREFDGGNRSILVSADHHILDGHHQWMRNIADSPKEPMAIIRLNAPIAELLPMVREMPSATTAKGATTTPKPLTEAEQWEVWGGEDVAADERSSAMMEADRLQWEASRSKPKNMVEFAKPITGPSGASLTAYEWKNELIEQANREGEMKLKRVSKWDDSAENPETGREIVHQFHVTTRDGEKRVVSLESALQVLGYGTASSGKAGAIKSLASVLKTRSRNLMELGPLEAEAKASDAWQEAYDRARRDVDTRKMPEMTTELVGTERQTRTWKRGDFEDGGFFGPWIIKPTDSDVRRFEESTRNGWITTEAKKVVGENPQVTKDLRQKITDLKRRIKKADAKILADTQAAQTALPPASAMDTRNADSRELFADDGGFKLAGDKTVDGDKVTAERKAKDDAKAKRDREQSSLFSSPASARDEQYMKLAKNGDTARASRMVKEEARRVGLDTTPYYNGVANPNPGPVYHQGIHNIHDGRKGGEFGFFFSRHKEVAEDYANLNRDGKGTVREVFLRIRRPLDLTKAIDGRFRKNMTPTQFVTEMANRGIAVKYDKAKLDAWEKSYRDKWNEEPYRPVFQFLASSYAREWGIDPEQIRRQMMDAGFDGMIMPDQSAASANENSIFSEPVSHIVFESNQIKSADPITRDENGDIIPLSQRFDASKDSILFASPTPEASAAVQTALEKMPPVFRNVFEAVNSGSTPAQVMAKFKISEKAVTNILNQVRSRVAAATGAAEASGLVPAMKDGKFDGGRPDLALSTNPTVAAIDQLRSESDIPDVRGWDEVNAQADALLKDYQGTYDALLAKARDLQPMTDAETAAAKKIIARETLQGKTQTPAERVKIAMMIHGYRDIGTETARALAIRRDPTMKPAERHAQFIAEALFTPDAETRKQLREAKKGQQEDILSGWMARVDSIKAELLAQGIDLDASLARFNRTEQARKTAEDDSPRVKAAIEDAIKKRTKREKAVIEAIRSGATATRAANLMGLTVPEIRPIWESFVADYRANVRASAKRFMENALAASPANFLAELEAEFGIYDWDMIDDTKPGFKDRRGEKPRKPAEPKAPKPTIPDLSPEQQAELDAAWERFKGTPPAGWSAFWQETMEKLAPMIGQTSFEQWKREATQPWTDIWQTEMEGIATPAARITFDEWIAKPANVGKVKRQGLLFPGPPVNETRGERSTDPNNRDRLLPLRPEDVNETTGEWDETRPFSGQGELMREDVNETTGTFDLNDPLAVKAVLDAFAIARGGKMDALMEFWKMSILSGPQTHVVNTGSNLLHGAYHLLPKRAAEATINTLLGIVGQGDAKAATFAEFAPMAKNLRKGFQLAARNALRSWQMETRVFDAYARAEALQLDFTGVGSEYIPPALGGKLGKIMRSLSFRAMTAADEFMKSLYAQVEAAGQAHRIAAVEEKLTGDAYDRRLAALMEPGSAAWLRAIDEAKRVTFQQDIDGTNPRAIARLDQLAELAKRGRNMPWIGRPLTFFLPFIDTPLNVFKQAVEMSPIGGALAVIDGARALKRRVLRGNLTPELAKQEAERLYDRARLVRDLSNQTIGIATILALHGLTQGDEDDLPVITGTVPYKSTKRGERDNAYAVLPPQTIRIGKLQFSYQRVEPFATFLASTVDLLVEMDRHGGMKPEVMSQWLARFKDQVKDKTFLQGVSDILNAVEDPDRFAERLTANVATGFIPNLVRQPVREADTRIRDGNPRPDDGFLTAVAKRVGFSLAPQSAPAKLDVWGNEVKSNRGDLMGGTRPTDMLFRVLDPTNATFGAQPDPLDAWIYRWNLQQADSKERIGIQPISNSVSGRVPGEKNARTFALTPAEQSAANKSAGQAARDMLGDGWEKQPLDPNLASRITDTVRRAQEIERARIRAEKLAEAVK